MTRAPMLTLLVIVSILAAVVELLFQYAYAGPVPLPLGSVVILLTMPWLIRTTVEFVPSIGAAAAPVVLWFLTTLACFTMFGLDGALVLAAQWQTLLLLATGILTGLVYFRIAVERLVAAAAAEAGSDGPAATTRPSDPRIRKAGRSA